jgi:flavin reductase (DIM6/NTAB) family NADH-FMN oxidoreductase RutF
MASYKPRKENRFLTMQKNLRLSDLQGYDRFTRANILNSLSGFKSASLIGTVNKNGQANLAIFSNLVHIGADPALVGFINRPLDAAPHTLSNIQETGSYTINHITADIFPQAHQSSAKYPADISEFDATGLTASYREGIIAPFVAESLVQYSLELKQIIPIELNGTFFVIGAIQEIFYPSDIQEEDGFLALEKAGSLCSLGNSAYYETKRLGKLAYAKP